MITKRYERRKDQITLTGERQGIVLYIVSPHCIYCKVRWSFLAKANLGYEGGKPSYIAEKRSKNYFDSTLSG